MKNLIKAFSCIVAAILTVMGTSVLLGVNAPVVLTVVVPGMILFTLTLSALAYMFGDISGEKDEKLD